MHTKYNYVNGLEDGLLQNWYENGQLDIEKNIKMGKKHGLSRNYHSNGQIEFEGEFNEGERIGSHKTWDEDGELIGETNYKNGIAEEIPFHTQAGISDEEYMQDTLDIISGTYKSKFKKK